MDPHDFLATVIQPATAALDLDSAAVQELLLGTAIQESGLRNIQQVGGPALGYFQMEPATHDDIWATFLSYRPELASRVKSLLPDGVPTPDQLISCPVYAAAMARLRYERAPAPLPPVGDLAGQAAYYKQWYNTPEGAATLDEYMSNWTRVVGQAGAA